MSSILQRTTNTIQIAEFWENHQLNKYNYNPVYQRKSVWAEEKQSFFIDSLLRNYPVPPIFLHKKINDATGKQAFDVIDGKQRLTSIIKFIQNEIPASSENNVDEDDNLAGIYFKDLDTNDLNQYKKLFWRYELQIQYVDTEDEVLIDKLFDRLNRNGEALTGQELRHSKYHSSILLQTVDEILNDTFWKERTKNYDLARMEDKEFISELLFATIENKPIGANKQDIIDSYYESYFNAHDIIDDAKVKFMLITNYLNDLNINYDKYSIKGVSHIYGLWCFAQYCFENDKDKENVSNKLVEFYTMLKEHSTIAQLNDNVDAYKKSMSSATKSQIQRSRRMEALKKFIFDE